MRRTKNVLYYHTFCSHSDGISLLSINYERAGLSQTTGYVELGSAAYIHLLIVRTIEPNHADYNMEFWNIISTRWVTIVLLVALCLSTQIVLVSGLFGEIIEDETTDSLFENMGQAEVTAFDIVDGVVNFEVTVEDHEGWQ